MAKLLQITLDDDLHMKLHLKSVLEKTSMSDIIRKYIENLPNTN